MSSPDGSWAVIWQAGDGSASLLSVLHQSSKECRAGLQRSDIAWVLKGRGIREQTDESTTTKGHHDHIVAT